MCQALNASHVFFVFYIAEHMHVVLFIFMFILFQVVVLISLHACVSMCACILKRQLI